MVTATPRKEWVNPFLKLPEMVERGKKHKITVTAPPNSYVGSKIIIWGEVQGLQLKMKRKLKERPLNYHHTEVSSFGINYEIPEDLKKEADTIVFYAEIRRGEAVELTRVSEKIPIAKPR